MIPNGCQFSDHGHAHLKFRYAFFGLQVICQACVSAHLPVTCRHVKRHAALTNAGRWRDRISIQIMISTLTKFQAMPFRKAA